MLVLFISCVKGTLVQIGSLNLAPYLLMNLGSSPHLSFSSSIEILSSRCYRNSVPVFSSIFFIKGWFWVKFWSEITTSSLSLSLSFDINDFHIDLNFLSLDFVVLCGVHLIPFEISTIQLMIWMLTLQIRKHEYFDKFYVVIY